MADAARHAQTVTFATDLYPVYGSPRCVHCHGLVNPSANPPQNHPTIGTTGCLTCHSTSPPDWRLAAASIFSTAQGIRSPREICTTVAASAQAASRSSFASHVQNDDLIGWAFSPTGPQYGPQGPAHGTRADFVGKSLRWFDAGKPCP
jgi:hypothetical protein